MKTIAIILLLLVSAVEAGEGDERLEANLLKRKPNKCGPDYVQYEKAGEGWFSNLGPTGIRALMTDKDGKIQMQGMASQFAVRYVFPKSPASLTVKPGDIIIGVNGERFKTPYKFGYWFGWGYEGPLTDLGKAVEAAEAKNRGKLDILLLRNGKEMTASVRMPMQTALAPNFPYGCAKSKKLRDDAIKWLLDNQKDGKWPGAAHAQIFSCIALLAQGDRYTKQVRKHLDTKVNSFDDRTWNWQLTMYAIVMCEYQFRTGTTKYEKTLRKINDLLKRNQRFANGTFGHEGNAGENGYGPMSGISGLSCLAWAMMEKAGIDIHKDAYEKTLITMDMELVRKDGDSPQGDYGYGWPEHGKKVYDYRPKEVTPSLNHLKVDIRTFNDARAAGIPKGAMALVHSIRPWQDYSPQVARHHVNKICRTRRCIVNGHGSGMLHGWMCFLALGYSANTGYAEPLRLALDANRDLMMSARCPDGSFYTQPQRDATGGDLHYGSRTLPTALWAMVLSIPDANLVMLGSEQSAKIKKAYDSAMRQVRMKRYATAVPLLEEAKKLGSQEAADELEKIAKLAEGQEAEKLYLTIRKNYQTAGKEKTKAALKKLIAEYPGTTAAKKSEAALKNM